MADGAVLEKAPAQHEDIFDQVATPSSAQAKTSDIFDQVSPTAPAAAPKQDWRDRLTTMEPHEAQKGVIGNAVTGLSNIGAGVLTPILHPIRTLESIGQTISAGGVAPGGMYPTTAPLGAGPTGRQSQQTNLQVQQTAQEAQAAQAAQIKAHPIESAEMAAGTALTGALAGEAAGAVGLGSPKAVSPEPPPVIEPEPPTAPPAPPPGGGGGGGMSPRAPQAGGGGGGVATMTRVETPIKLSPADQAIADRIAAEQNQGTVPPEVRRIRAQAAEATKAANKAEFEFSQQLQEQRAARAHGDEPPPFDPEAGKKAELLRARAKELSETAERATKQPPIKDIFDQIAEQAETPTAEPTAPTIPEEVTPSGSAPAPQTPRPLNPDLAAAAAALTGRPIGIPSTVPEQVSPGTAQPQAPQGTPQTPGAAAPPTPSGAERPVVQASTDPAAIRQSAQEQKPHLETNVQTVADQVPGAEVEGIRVKSPESVENKEDRGKPPETNIDHLGARVSVPTAADVPAVQQQIESKLPVVSKEKITNNGVEADQYGIQTGAPGDPNQVSELQVVTKPVAEAMTETDDLYAQQKKLQAEADSFKKGSWSNKRHQELADAIGDQIRTKMEAAQKEAQGTGGGGGSAAQQQPGAAPAAGPAQPSAAFSPKKGDRVQMADGRPATVTHTDPRRGMVGIKLDDGRAYPVVPISKIQPAQVAQGAPAQNQTPTGQLDQPGLQTGPTTISGDHEDKSLHVDLHPIGAPIPKRVAQIKALVEGGTDVHIFTARVGYDPEGKARAMVNDWVTKNIGRSLPIVNAKDDNEAFLLDDHANVAPNVNEPMQIPPIPDGKWLGVDLDKTLAYAHTGEQAKAKPESLDAKKVRALSETLNAENPYGQTMRSIYGDEDWEEMSEDKRRDAIEQDYDEAEKEEEEEREKKEADEEADRELDRRIAYMDGKQKEVESLLNERKVPFVAKGESTYSRYLTVDLPDDEIGTIRISDHAPPVGRGGMKEGGLDYHDEADVSLHPGSDSLTKVERFLKEKGVANATQSGISGHPSAATTPKGGGEQTDAVQKPSPAKLLQPQPEETPETGRERRRVESVERGEEPAREGGTAEEEKPLERPGGGEKPEEVKTKPSFYKPTAKPTPQVAPMAGMTPLGTKEAKAQPGDTVSYDSLDGFSTGIGTLIESGKDYTLVQKYGKPDIVRAKPASIEKFDMPEGATKQVEQAKPTKAAIIPTRGGVRVVPIEDDRERKLSEQRAAMEQSSREADEKYGPLVIRSLETGKTTTIKPVEKPAEKEQNNPSEEAQHEQPSASEARGGRPPADTGGANREGVAPVETGVRKEPVEGKEPEISGQPSGAVVHPTGKPVRGARPGRGPSEGSAASLDSSPAQPLVEQANKQQRKRVKLNQDWYQHPDDWQAPSGAMTRLDGNIAALEILRDIQKNPRKLTDDEKTKLAAYVGWGALPKVFDERYQQKSYYESGSEAQEKNRWRAANARLKELLSPEEYAAARRSTQNAHYTSPEVVRFMWDAVKRMGFKSGNVLEPSIGTGNFFGMMPAEIRAAVNGVADELDPVTHGIAQLLYPGATVFNKDFIELIIPDNEIDLAIGNVPFGEAVYDPKYPKMKARIHDYFFVKSMDKVKPGGMVAFITSTGTMDKANAAIRHILASQADLITAFRLPSSAFKANAGTEVTTDVIFLRKRLPTENLGGEPWITSSTMNIPADGEDRLHSLSVNEFYHKHPENMLGRAVASGRMYGGLNFMLNPSDTPIEELLAKALASVPRGVLGTASESKPSGVDTASTDAAYASDDLKEYQYTVDKRQLKQRIQGKLVRPASVIDKSGVVNSSKVDRIKAMVGLRDKLNGLMAAMATMPDDEESNAGIAKAREDLRKSYDSFVKQYGYLNSTYNGLFREDPHYPRLLALENYDKSKKKGEPADIFQKRTIFPRQPLKVVSSDPKEALQQILGERGYPDVNLMAQLQGKEPKDVAATLVKTGLVFRDPVSGEYETREKYLSGYVRDKLDDARNAVKQGSDEYKPNVEALEKIQPADLEISDNPETSISVRLGGTWIPIPALEDFFEETFKSAVNIGYANGNWSVDPSSKWTPEIVTEWAGGGIKADELFQLALNQKQPTVYFPKNSDGTGGGIDSERTTGARAMQERIRQEFQKWAGQSKEWKAPLEKAYNYAFNNLVSTDYDGSHLTFPGMNPSIRLKAHQVNAVWRMLQDGKALLAHEVGAGKTFEMVAAAMEGKRVGLFKKPMIAVPNHIVDQFRKEFLLLYPGANILVPTEKDFDSKNRQRIMAQIATGDYDAVILPHSQFNLMDISPERQLVTIEKQMDELEESLAAMKKEAGSRDRSVKELEKAKEKLRTRIAELKNLKADKAINFDDTGVDALFIDEAHEYKNLSFYTKMTRIAGIQQGNAKRALRLKMKTEYLQDKNKGRGVFFATGTPVQNTMAELYTQIKYVAPDVLEKAGIRFFDDWAANFGSTITAMELSADGRSFKARTKFARFQNVPELMQMFRSFADVKTAADLNLPRPDLEGGKPIVVSVPGSEILDQYVKDLMERAANLPKDPKIDNMLKIVSEGRKAATDMRLLDQAIEDEHDSKINVAVRQVYREWEQGRDDKTTQMIFLDMYRATDADDRELINLYDDMRKKLVASGVTANQVAVIGEHNTRLKRQALFDKMNTGEVRILLGSTQKMGSGTNAQQKMKALHHIDLTWRPGDLTQREGRILRQGNENKTVRIYNYLTERSFDAYMAQTLQSKAEFLSQILSGRAKGRTALDAAADMVLSLEEMKVAASGNPDIKKKYDLEMRLSQLYSLERQFAAKQREIAWRAESAELSVANNRTRAKVLEKSMAKVEAVRGKDGDGFELEVDGQKFTDSKNATTYLEAMELPPGTFWMKVNGINVAVKPRVESRFKGEAETHIEYSLEYENQEHTVPEQTMVSLARSINARLREIPSDIRRSLANAERDEEEAKRYREQLKKKDFPEKGDLEQVEKDLREVEKRLGLGSINTGSQASGEEAQADVDAESPEAEPLEKEEEEDEELEDEPKAFSANPSKNPLAGGRGAKLPSIGSTTFAFGFADPAVFQRLFPQITNRIAEWVTDEETTEKLQKELMRESRGQMDRRVAIAMFKLKDAARQWTTRSHDESLRFWDAVESGDLSRLGSDRDRDLANVFKAAFDSMRAELQALKPEILQNYIENYFPHIWERPSHAAGIIKSLLTGKRPFAGKGSFLKKRTIPTMQDGIDLGFEPKSWNPVDSFLLKYSEMAQFLMAHQTLEVMKNSGTAKYVAISKKAPDGWTQIDDRIGTVYRRVTALDEEKLEDVTQPLTYPRGKRAYPGAFSEDIEDATHGEIALVGHYYAPADAAKVFNNYVSKGIAGRSAIYDTLRWMNDNLNALQLGISAFHATTISVVGQASDLALGIQQLTEGKPVKFGAALARWAMIAPSIFNTVRNGSKLLSEYLSPGSYSKMSKEAAAIGIAGGRVKQNVIEIKALDKAVNSFRNGAILKGLSAVPGAIIQSLTGPVMEYYVPRMKLGIFYGLAHDILDEAQRGNLSPEKVRGRLDEAWNSVDNRAGQMVYENLFWNKAVRDMAQIGTRSVGWNYGSFAEAFGAVTGAVRVAGSVLVGKKPRITPALAFALALPMTTALIGGSFNYMRTGKPPDTLKDYFYLRSADGTYLNIPGYMKDVFSFAHDPIGTVENKMAPLWEATAEALHNRDFYGVEIRHKDDTIPKQVGEVAEWAAKQAIPFSFSSAGKLLEHQGAQPNLESMLAETMKHPTDLLASQLGFTAAPAFIQNSKALNMAREYGMANRPPGTKTKEQASRTQAMHVVEDMYQAKKIDQDAIAAYKKAGILSEVDLVKARLYARTAPIVPAVRSLSPEQAINVYKAGTPEEQRELRSLIELKGRELGKIEDKDQRDKLRKAYHDALNPRATFKPGTPIA